MKENTESEQGKKRNAVGNKERREMQWEEGRGWYRDRHAEVLQKHVNMREMINCTNRRKKQNDEMFWKEQKHKK